MSKIGKSTERSTPVETNAESKKTEQEFQLKKFAQLQRQALLDLTKNSTRQVTYQKYTKEQLIRYLKSPSANEKNIRNASIYMYDVSSQYRRLVSYYAQMPLWAYTVSPVKFDPSSVNSKSFKKAYMKAVHTLEIMNIKHEMQKATTVAFREGVFYGVRWSTNNSFFIQKLDPDICKLSSIVDGTWMFAVDFSKIKEEELGFYPPQFADLFREYTRSGDKWQEIPEEISFCLKADETTSTYSIPPWASTLPLLYDIETYKELQEASTRIANYKLITLLIPTGDDGTPLFSFNVAEQYYQHLVNSLPSYVGAAMLPMKVSSIDFEQSNRIKDVDTVSKAEEQFWTESGTSPLLFGSARNDTAGALKLSVYIDESIVFSIVSQAERLINRILSRLSGSHKFRINFIKATNITKDEMTARYKEAATLGLPVKSAYAALLGHTPGEILGMDYVEMEVLNMGDLTPLSSSYTQPSSESGRPKSSEVELTESGEQTRDNDSNANR